MTTTSSSEILPPHFFCNCVPHLGPAHCHRCSESADRPVQWEDAPCKELVESLAYNLLLNAGADDAMQVASEAFDASQAAPKEAAPAPATVPVPAPPKTKLVSALEVTAKSSKASPPKTRWRFTNLARGQVSERGLELDDIKAILDGPHVVVPSHSGTAVNHYSDDLLIMVDEGGECVISVIERKKSDAEPGDASRSSAATSTVRYKTHSGGSGRRMPSTVKELLAMLKEYGFASEIGGKGHHLITHTSHPGVRISIPSSPSDRRSFTNAVADIKRRTGIDITKKSV